MLISVMQGKFNAQKSVITAHHIKRIKETKAYCYIHGYKSNIF